MQIQGTKERTRTLAGKEDNYIIQCIQILEYWHKRGTKNDMSSYPEKLIPQRMLVSYTKPKT